MAANEPWVVEGLCRLCALATEVQGYSLLLHEHRLAIAAQHLSHVVRWDLEDQPLNQDVKGVFQALLRFPSLRHVRVEDLAFCEDHSQAACRWETLTVESLDDIGDLLRLPSGVGRVVVTQDVVCLGEEAEAEVAAVLEQWGPGRLVVETHHPPSERDARQWRLDGVGERLGGLFGLVADSAEAMLSYAQFLRQRMLPPGGGPHTLALHIHTGVALTLRQLAPLLAGTCVRTLCMGLWHESAPLGDLLSALPPSVSCLRLMVNTVEQAREVVSGEAVAHRLRLVVLCTRSWCQSTAADEQQLGELCAAHQPLVELEVKPVTW